MIGHTRNRTKQMSNSAVRLAKEHYSLEKTRWTVNPGDRIAATPQTIEEKSKQLAVNAPDITGDHIKVPTYFIVEYPNGKKEALHHVKDAEKISDVIRQARFEEEDWGPKTAGLRQNLNSSGLIFIIILLLITVPILIGIF
ncbi:MAG: hypothetical protein JOZ78_19525 [Chroococcidiopsidaceae cyanobacterium CP_BM_ER_R8_30]|nr:hypothetical protein [Chroococcidiopsidaceae cyanobacterium CP_BM_ER_R8_30]